MHPLRASSGGGTRCVQAHSRERPGSAAAAPGDHVRFPHEVSNLGESKLSSPENRPRFTSPSREVVLGSTSGFSEAERCVFQSLDLNLPGRWEIFLRPHLNGLRPDCILMNPTGGLVVLGIIERWDERLVDERALPGGGGMGHTMVQESRSRSYDALIGQLLRIRKEIYELYCPRIGSRLGARQIAVGIICPAATGELVRGVFAPLLEARGFAGTPSLPVAGLDDLKSGDFKRVLLGAIPAGCEPEDHHLAYQDLRHWLVEPSFSAATRSPLDIDPDQERLATDRTQRGYRRIRGPAGSGKSLILAARAAELVDQGKQILVVTFNITLLHYLRALADRRPSPNGNKRAQITWLNFHAWCKRVCQEAGKEAEYRELWKRRLDGDPASDLDGEDRDEILEHELPRLVSQVLELDEQEHVSRYDAILVDEGQDYLPEWWSALRKACRAGGEMLLVADLTQNVYGTSSNWTDEAMRGAGFAGPWVDIRKSYRLPVAVARLAERFARLYMRGETLDLPEASQLSLDLSPCTLRWVQASKHRAAQVCRDELLRMPESTEPDQIAFADTVFLASSVRLGQEVVGLLKERKIRTIHTFGSNGTESRRLKLAFFLGDARIKATTLHSFKGWESRSVVMHVGEAPGKKARAVFYSGLTRLKRHPDGSSLTVVCTNPEFEAYGKEWPDFSKA